MCEVHRSSPKFSDVQYGAARFPKVRSGLWCSRWFPECPKGLLRFQRVFQGTPRCFEFFFRSLEFFPVTHGYPRFAKFLHGFPRYRRFSTVPCCSPGLCFSQCFCKFVGCLVRFSNLLQVSLCLPNVLNGSLRLAEKLAEDR